MGQKFFPIIQNSFSQLKENIMAQDLASYLYYFSCKILFYIFKNDIIHIEKNEVRKLWFQIMQICQVKNRDDMCLHFIFDLVVFEAYNYYHIKSYYFNHTLVYMNVLIINNIKVRYFSNVSCKHLSSVSGGEMNFQNKEKLIL